MYKILLIAAFYFQAKSTLETFDVKLKYGTSKYVKEDNTVATYKVTIDTTQTPPIITCDSHNIPFHNYIVLTQNSEDEISTPYSSLLTQYFKSKITSTEKDSQLKVQKLQEKVQTAIQASFQRGIKGSLGRSNSKHLLQKVMTKEKNKKNGQKLHELRKNHLAIKQQ